MKTIYDIIKDWEAGKISVEDANKKLKDSGLYLDPNKNVITVKEMEETTISPDFTIVNGYGELDTGTGTRDKVKIINSKLIDVNTGDSYALVIIGPIMFKVENGENLVYHGVISAE